MTDGCHSGLDTQAQLCYNTLAILEKEMRDEAHESDDPGVAEHSEGRKSIRSLRLVTCSRRTMVPCERSSNRRSHQARPDMRGSGIQPHRTWVGCYPSCRRIGMKPGAALAAMRGRHWHVCPSCGKRFSGIKTARYCSNACRQKAKYKRSHDIQEKQ